MLRDFLAKKAYRENSSKWEEICWNVGRKREGPAVEVGVGADTDTDTEIVGPSDVSNQT